MNNEKVLYVDENSQLAGNVWSIEVNGVVVVFESTVVPIEQGVGYPFPYSEIVTALMSLEPFDATIQILDPIN